jgi:TrmH family RNA methyltransferase
VFQSCGLAERASRFARRKNEDPHTRRDEALAFVSADQTWRPPDWFERVAVVLVETKHAVNIGGVVRAMANTGFSSLRLVNPAEFDAWHIVGIAHYTQHIVESARIYQALPEAVADASLVIGLTGKHHRVERNALPLHEAVTRLAQAAHADQQVAVVFGREDWGLSNSMLDACHFVTTIPTNPAYPSLNLAQAALLVLYELFLRSGGDQQSFRPPRRAAPPASSALFEDMFADLERALDAVGFLKSRPRTSTLRSVRVLLFRARLSVREASLLRALAMEIRHYLHRKGLLAEIGEVGAPRDD